MTEVIDPSWWTSVVGDEDFAEFEAVDSFAGLFRAAATREGVSGIEWQVLDTLATVSSAMLQAGNWLQPFVPAITLRGRRSALPADLDPEELALLTRIAPLVSRADLRARVADVAWFYGDRSNTAVLDVAIDAYRAAPLSEPVWSDAGEEAWRRAFELIRRRGPAGEPTLREMADTLRERVVTGTEADGFAIGEIAALLREHVRLDAAAQSAVHAALLTLAAGGAGTDPRMARRLEREAAAWLKRSDARARSESTDRIARLYVAEAESRSARDSGGPSGPGALAAGTVLEKAIATFRSLPRSYRVEHGIDTLIEELRERLRVTRETSFEQMSRIASDPVDLTEASRGAREHVSGHDNPFDALCAFATLVPPMDVDRATADAEESVAGSIRYLLGSVTFSEDHRKVAARDGGVSDESPVQDELLLHTTIQSQLVAVGLIQPALDLLTREHRFDRRFMVRICAESPVVPEGHSELWGAGLWFGLGEDFGAALAVLAPQLEQTVRVLLKGRGVYTLLVEEGTGVESEKGLNALLALPETVDIFGAGMVVEMQALLITQGGPNLRNTTAHGLVSDAAAYGYHSMFVWWFCLRLVLIPLINARQIGASG